MLQTSLHKPSIKEKELGDMEAVLRNCDWLEVEAGPDDKGKVWGTLRLGRYLRRPSFSLQAQFISNNRGIDGGKDLPQAVGYASAKTPFFVLPCCRVLRASGIPGSLIRHRGLMLKSTAKPVKAQSRGLEKPFFPSRRRGFYKPCSIMCLRTHHLYGAKL